MTFSTIEQFVGNTPLAMLKRLPGDTGNAVLVKLEGNNPAGSVKDRPALSMIVHAEQRGEIAPGDTLIEATSGNTGIALAMAAAMRAAPEGVNWPCVPKRMSARVPYSKCPAYYIDFTRKFEGRPS